MPASSKIDTSVPQIRPHIHRRGAMLYFMISARPILELAPEEISLYDSIDGRRSIGELEQDHSGAFDYIIRWHKAEILELVQPISPPSIPHIVVVEPHADDAALSVGGRLCNRRGKCRITILSVVKRSNFTSYLISRRNTLSVDEVTEIRKRESDLAAKLLGAEHRSLDWTDAPLRFLAAEHWSSAMAEVFQRDPGAFVNLFPRQADVAEVAEQLRGALRNLSPDELWIPMGLGDHVDHRTTRSACLTMLAKYRHEFSNCSVSIYEEIPYDKVAHAGQIQAELVRAGARIVRSVEDVTDVFNDKLRAVSVYASQFKLAHMENRVRRSAVREGGEPGKLAEVYYRLEGPLDVPPESSLSRNWESFKKLRKDTARLRRKATRHTRLTLIALPSGHLGRWKTNCESLGATFPRAALETYVAEEVAWEAGPGENDCVTPRIVRREWREWARIVSRELFRFGTPMVLLWSGAYEKGFKKRLVRWLFPFRPVLFCTNLSDFVGILDEQL